MTPPPSAAAAQPARRLAPPRPRTVPARPRRISGPARPGHRTAPPLQDRDGFVVGLVGAAETISSHPILDRLIRGRLWIGIVAFALIGIVALQLALLKLNSGIGVSLERQAGLQTAIAALRIENSELASGTRVESQAAQLGMSPSGVSSLHFLSASPEADVARAAQVLRTPLVPVSEPPGATEAAASAAGPSAAPTSGTEAPKGSEGSPGAEARPQEGSTQAAPGATPAAGPQEPSSTSRAGEAGAATAPAAGSTGAAAPTGEGGGAGATGGSTAGPGG